MSAQCKWHTTLNQYQNDQNPTAILKKKSSYRFFLPKMLHYQQNLVGGYRRMLVSQHA
jgi:hypothetical protein